MSSKFINQKNIFVASIRTERGCPSVISYHDKINTLFYGSTKNVVILDLNNPLKSDLYTEHSSPVTVAKVSPSGYYCCSGDLSGNIRVWATNNVDKTLKLELKPLSKIVRDICWSSDSQRICVVGEGKGQFGAVFMYDSGSSVGVISGHSGVILSCDIRPVKPYRIVTCGEDLSVNFFLGPPFKFSHSNSEHTKYVNCCKFSPDGSKFITCSSDKSLQLFEGKEGKKIKSFNNIHGGSIYSCGFLSDSKKFITTSFDKSMKLWEIEESEKETKLKEINKIEFGKAISDMIVGSVVIKDDNIVTVSLNSDINIVDGKKLTNKENGAIIKTIYGHNGNITKIVFNKQTKQLFSCGSEGRLIEWDINNGSVRKLMSDEIKSTINNIAVLKNSKVFVGCANCDIIEISFEQKEMMTLSKNKITLEKPSHGIVGNPAIENEIFIVNQTSIMIFNESLEKKYNLDVSYEPNNVDISSNGKIVAVSGGKKLYIYEYDGSELKEKIQLFDHTGKIETIKFSNNGKFLASGDSNREIIVFETNEFKPFYVNLVHHSASVTDMDWREDDKYLISSSLDKNIIVWDLENKDRQIVNAHVNGSTSCCFLDDKTFASAGNDFCVKTWEFGF